MAQNPARQQAEHQPEVSGNAPLAETQDQRARNQALERLQRLEHLAEDPDVEAHPLPPADRGQPWIQAGAAGGRPRAKRLDQLRLEFRRDRLVGLLPGEVRRRVGRLAAAVERDLLHPLPVDQPGGLLPGADQLAQDDGADADRHPPGHGAADTSSGIRFRNAHGYRCSRPDSFYRRLSGLALEGADC